MKKIICLALLAGLFLFANSCHDDEIKQDENLNLKSALIKEKEAVSEVKIWFESNPEDNSFALLKWSKDINWSKALVMEIDSSIVIEIPIKLESKYKVMDSKDSKLNVEHRLLFTKKNGIIKSYVEYFISKKGLEYLQDSEKVNYSKKSENFDGRIILENSKGQSETIYHSETSNECEELTLKSVEIDSCRCLVENFSDGSYQVIYVISCTYTGSDGGYGGSGGSNTSSPSIAQVCNCDICPICQKCKNLLKSVPIPVGNTTTIISNPCGVCTCPATVPVVDASELQNNVKANCIYQKLINGGILSNFISRYFGPTQPNQSYLGELNLTWDLAELSGTAIAGTFPLGDPNNGKYNSVEITLDISELNAKPVIIVALAMLHEALHAKMIAEYYDTTGTTDFKSLITKYLNLPNMDIAQETAMLNTYSTQMSNALYSFDPSHTLDFYKEAVRYNLARQISSNNYSNIGQSNYSLLLQASKICK